MTRLTPLMRAFRSELLKCRRWSMVAGMGIMLVLSAFFAYLTIWLAYFILLIVPWLTGRSLASATR